MAACLQCGKKYESDYMLWKGGIGRCLCTNCLDRELQENEIKKDNELKNHPQTNNKHM